MSPLKRLDLLECDGVVDDLAEVLATVCLDDDEVAYADVEAKIREIKQIGAPSPELDNVERPRYWYGGERDALAEIVEIGLGHIRGASLDLLGVKRALLGLDHAGAG